MVLLLSEEKYLVLHATRLGGELELGEFGASSSEVSNCVGVRGSCCEGAWCVLGVGSALLLLTETRLQKKW
jgi:hypothetical protein